MDPKTSGWASKRTRKTQRDGHNSGVKIWSLCSVSSILSHATLKQPFRTLAIKWEVNIFLKKSSCVFLPSCVLYSCVLYLCVLYSCVCRLSCVCYHCVGMYPVYICIWEYNTCSMYKGHKIEKDLLDKYGWYSHVALQPTGRISNNISTIQRTEANMN